MLKSGNLIFLFFFYSYKTLSVILPGSGFICYLTNNLKIEPRISNIFFLSSRSVLLLSSLKPHPGFNPVNKMNSERSQL